MDDVVREHPGQKHGWISNMWVVTGGRTARQALSPAVPGAIPAQRRAGRLG